MGSASNLIPGVFGAKKAVKSLSPDIPAPPPIAPVVEMPDPLAQQQTKRRSIVEQLSRSGRAGTVLTNNQSNKLGS